MLVITSWSRVLFEKLTGLQLVKKLPRLMEPPPTELHAPPITFFRPAFLSGTTFISQNVLRTLLLYSLKANCLKFSTLVCDTLRFFRAFSSVVRQTPGYNSQDGARPALPNFPISVLCVLFVCNVLLPPGVNPTAVKYMYHIIHNSR
jgi:hypothetical protein